MTTTTKIFVILVCLFSFIFTPLAISFAAQKENWRKLANDYRSELAVAYANELSVAAVSESEAQRYTGLYNQAQTRVADLENQVGQLTRDVADLTRERDQLARSREDWETSARLLTAEMTVKSQHNEELSTAKEDALARQRELQTRNLQLADRVKELNAKLVIATQKLRQNIEEIAAYRDENQRLRQATGMGQAATPLTAVPSPKAEAVSPATTSPIVGKVTAVQDKLATIDVGSASGVRQGLRMIVLRDESYVCDLRITSQVTPNEAVGEVALETDKRIRPGDRVEDADSFARR